MRDHSWLVAFMLVASAGASGFILGHHYPVHRASDISTRTEIVDAMADEVGLDARQRAEVIAISDRYRDQMQAIRTKVAGDLAAIRSEVRAQTRAVMTEEQKKRFDAYCERRDEQRARADR